MPDGEPVLPAANVPPRIGGLPCIYQCGRCWSGLPAL